MQRLARSMSRAPTRGSTRRTRNATLGISRLRFGLARDGVMLRWLDGDLNTKTRPNENFAREFWELFTLGVDNGYDQDDIVESARAFTGWRSRLNTTTGQRYVEFDASRHDTGDKSFFGRTITGQNATDDRRRGGFLDDVVDGPNSLARGQQDQQGRTSRHEPPSTRSAHRASDRTTGRLSAAGGS